MDFDTIVEAVGYRLIKDRYGETATLEELKLMIEQVIEITEKAKED